MSKGLPLHGRDHRPGGADPITGLDTSYPTFVNLFDPVVQAALGYSTSGSYSLSWPVATGIGSDSATGPLGWYITSTDQVDQLTFYTRLGPRGSIWQPIVWYWGDTDGGKFKIGISAISEASYLADWGSDPDDPTDFSGLINDDGNTSMFFPGDVTGASGFGWNIDTYDASPGWNETYGNRIRLMGADGAYPTTSTTWTTSTFDAMELDSGAGIYEIRIVPDGKNASSSGYEKRFGALLMIRTTGHFAPVS